MIPRIFHQIWVGPDPFPDEFAAFQETWRTHHPDWELRFWTEDNLPAASELRRPEVLERLRVPAERSDILRLDLLHQHGGVYLDTDFECKRPIDDLIGDVDFFVADLKPGRPNNAIIGAVPGHPILERALEQAQFREFFGHDKNGTGPLFFNRILAEFPPVKSFDPPVFYPSTIAEREDAVAIHHMARSWKDAKGFQKSALRAEERLAKTQHELEKTKQRLERAERRLEAAGSGSPLRRLRDAVAARRR